MKKIKLLLALALLLSAMHTISAQVGKFIVSAPAGVAGDYNYVSLTNGWGQPATGLCGELVLMLDSTGASLGCLPPVTNVAGKIAFVERGVCGFSAKVLAAQTAGAIGVIIGNSAAAVPGALGGGLPQITIPSALISNADGLKLKAELLAGGVIQGCMSLPDVKVSFLVDMKGQTVDPSGVFLAYSIEGGAPGAHPMKSIGGGLYTDTLTMPATSEVLYVFVNGAAISGAETVPAACRATPTDNVRYVFSSTGGGDLDKVCFGGCARCENVVTLKVDMRQKTVPASGVHVAGNFQGWNPATTAMTNAGNGVWTYTFAAKPGDTLEYLFVNGNAAGLEEKGIIAGCGKANATGGFNRIYVVPNEDAIALPAVCFDSCGACPAPGLVCDPGALICDSFDSYALGGLNAQSPNWDTWDGTGGDGIVSIEQAKSGAQSLKVDFTLPGATQDVILLLGDSTKGNYLLKWKMFIPAGKKAYYNVQHDLAPHIWACDVYFEANGAGRVAVGSTALGTFKYKYDTWFNVEQYIDITNDATYFRVSDTLSAVWKFSLASDGSGGATTSKQLSGVDFYPIDNTYKYYVDDVQFVKLAAGVANEFCLNAVDIAPLFGKAVGVVQNSALYNNNGANAVGDPKTGYACFGEPTGNAAKPSLENTVWFKFRGDGNAYFIETGQCTATNANYINDGDTQMAIYEGTGCGALTPVLCNEDGPSATATLYPAGDTLQTVTGKTYYMLVDGFAFNGAISDGEFCIKVKRMAPIVSISDVSFDNGIRISPNPTNGVTNIAISLPEVTNLTVRVTNSLGQLVETRREKAIQTGNITLDMAGFGKGLYFVELSDEVNHTTRRVVVQ